MSSRTLLDAIKNPESLSGEEFQALASLYGSVGRLKESLKELTYSAGGYFTKAQVFRELPVGLYRIEPQAPSVYNASSGPVLYLLKHSETLIEVGNPRGGLVAVTEQWNESIPSIFTNDHMIPCSLIYAVFLGKKGSP